MKDGFLKAAALSPALRVADCAYNTRQILTELRAAAARGVKLAVFPEFCLTGYTCGDLFLQRSREPWPACRSCWMPAGSWTPWPLWACP
jgi:NAD+ synthase (glutamine-hydrolysing)